MGAICDHFDKGDNLTITLTWMLFDHSGKGDNLTIILIGQTIWRLLTASDNLVIILTRGTILLSDMGTI